MNPSEKDWEENKVDLLLFEYLEGELSEEQTKELQDKLASDASLQTELAHWQDAFYTQNFYHTEHIEKSLLKEEIKTVDSTVSGFIVVFLLLTSLFSFLPFATKKESLVVSVPIYASVTDNMEKQQAIVGSSQKQTLPIETASQVVQKQEVRRNFEESSISLRNIEIKELPTVVILSPQVNPDIKAIPKVGLRKIQVQKPLSIRKISGKERRKIERMKEKALQRRIANKFIKGRVPYVVPLDTKNF